MSARTKYLSTALAVVAVIATVAVARTLHTPTAPARETVGSAALAPRALMPARIHGIVGCGPAAPGLDCDEVEQLLPQ
jgi:hypothetical protein